jgi:hypothetical protein
VRGGVGPRGVAFAADGGAFAVLSGDDVEMPGIGVALAQMVLNRFLDLYRDYRFPAGIRRVVGGAVRPPRRR